MATRQSLISSLKQRVRYYGKQGFVFVDFRPEDLSTQKLVALSKLKGRRFLDVLQPTVEVQAVAAKETKAQPISYKAFREIKLKETQAELAAKKVKQRVQKYQKEGFSFEGVSNLDILTMGPGEVARISRLSREAFIREFGTTYTYWRKPMYPNDPGSWETTTADKALEFFRLVRLEAREAEKHGVPAPHRTLYAKAGNIDKIINELKSHLNTAYWSEYTQDYLNNYIKALSRFAGNIPEVDYIMHKIMAMDRDVAAKLLMKAYYDGIDAADIKVIYMDVMGCISRIYRIFGIKEKYTGEDGVM